MRSRSLFLATLLIVGCGGSNMQAGPAYRTAVHVARTFCAAVALLPDPAPAEETSGGEAPSP